METERLILPTGVPRRSAALSAALEPRLQWPPPSSASQRHVVGSGRPGDPPRIAPETGACLIRWGHTPSTTRPVGVVGVRATSRPQSGLGPPARPGELDDVERGHATLNRPNPRAGARLTAEPPPQAAHRRQMNPPQTLP